MYRDVFYSSGNGDVSAFFGSQIGLDADFAMIFAVASFRSINGKIFLCLEVLMERMKWPRGRVPDTTDEAEVADDNGQRFSGIGFGKEEKGAMLTMINLARRKKKKFCNKTQTNTTKETPCRLVLKGSFRT